MILQNPEAMEEALNRFEGTIHALEDRFKSQALKRSSMVVLWLFYRYKTNPCARVLPCYVLMQSVDWMA